MQSEATISKLALYCLCKEEPNKSPDSVVIGCSKQRFCHSKLERLATLKRPGGDWFHYYCVGLDSVPSKNIKWFCPMCKAKMKQSQPTTKALLSRELSKHDLKLMNFSIFRGKDTLLSCFSHVMYGNFTFHAKVKEALHNILHDVISRDLFIQCWQSNSMESLDCKDPDQFLMYKIFPAYRLCNLPPSSENTKHYVKTLSVTENLETCIHLLLLCWSRYLDFKRRRSTPFPYDLSIQI